MDIDDLKVYQQAMKLAEKVWIIVMKWDAFAKYPIGKQYTEAAQPNDNPSLSNPSQISTLHNRNH